MCFVARLLLCLLQQNEANSQQLQSYPAVDVKPLEGLGHESPMEDPKRMTIELLAFLESA